MNKDNFVDFYLSNAGGKDALFLSDGRGGFQAKEFTGGSLTAQFTDFDNDGLLDLVTRTNEGVSLRRGLGNSLAEPSAISNFKFQN